MRHTVTKNKGGFAPVTVTLTCDSQDELDALTALLGAAPQAATAVAEAYGKAFVVRNLDDVLANKVLGNELFNSLREVGGVTVDA